jgi:hypothetical protein
MPSLSLDNKVLLYNTTSTKPYSIFRIQTPQIEILPKIGDAPFYVSNLTLHTDLNVPFV